MSDYVKVQGHSNLVRDMKTHAIINKDKNAYSIAKRTWKKTYYNQEENREIENKI